MCRPERSNKKVIVIIHIDNDKTTHIQTMMF